MDEERDIPSEMGCKVFYEEGEEWRFKGPIKMPVRVAKLFEKLEKERKKAGDDEVEIVRLEEERRNILDKWEREKRIKLGLEKANVKGVNDVTPPSTPKSLTKKTPNRKSTKVVEKEGDNREWTPAITKPLKKTTSRRGQKAVNTSLDSKTGIIGKMKGNSTLASNRVVKKENGIEIFSSIIETSETKNGVQKEKKRKLSKRL